MASLPDGVGPRTVLLGADPVTELAGVLRAASAGDLAVGGEHVSALFAGLAAGAHLLVRAGGDRRADVQAVARAAALARLAGRIPLTPEQVRGRWG